MSSTSDPRKLDGSSSNGKRSVSGESSIDSQLDEATLEYLQACESGNPPDQEQFLKRYPQFADQLREFFVQREKLDELVGHIPGFRELLKPNHAASDPPVVFGDYELLREIGRGGMGVIYEARSRKLKRVIALKMTTSHGRPGDDSNRRFQAEAEAAATLEHPNIVPIYEVGSHDDRPYFTMKLVKGGNLKQRIANGPLPSKLAAQAAGSIADAIHHAHQRGVLHRDLKPSNILIDDLHGDTSRSSTNGSNDAPSDVENGSGNSDSSIRTRQGIQPMVSDFGLAKRLDQDSEFTMTGAVLGTPSYMSPEQASGSSAQCTTATDIYGIGAILYNMLTGLPPFSGQTQVDITLKVIKEPPDSIRRINPKIDLDLETICLKCLEKKPEQRYATAGLLADDLARYLDGKPIEARRSSSLEQIVKWARRKPALASLLFVVAASALIMVAGLYRSNRAIRAEQSRTLDALGNVQSQREKTLQALWQAHLNEARGHRESANGGHRAASISATKKAAELMKDIAVTEDQRRDLRSEYIADLAIPIDVLPIQEFSGEPVTELRRIVSFDDRLTTMSTVQSNNDVVLTDVATGNEIRRLPLNARFQAQLSPDGKFLVADEKGTDELFFCPANGDGPITRTGVRRTNYNFVCGAKSRILYVADKRDVQSFDLHSGEKIRSLPLISSASWLASSRDGNRLAAVNRSGELIIIDATSGKSILRTRIDGGPLGQCEFSPDGKQIVVAGGYRATIMVLDIETGRETMQFPSKSEFTDSARIDASGKYLFGGDWSKKTRIWDLQTGELVLNTAEHLLGASTVNNRLALRLESNVKVCELQPSPLFWHSQGHEMGRHHVRHTSFHSQLPLAVSGGDDGVRIVHTETRAELAYLPIGPVKSAMFHPVDGSVVTWGYSGLLRWPFSPAKEGNWEIGPFEKIPVREDRRRDEIAISQNGKSLAGAFYHGGGFVIDWSDRSTVQTLEPHAGSSRVSVSPDGKYVITGNWKGQFACLWNSETGELVRRLAYEDGGWAFPVFSSCGNQLAVATPAGTKLYDTATFETFGQVPPASHVPAFSPDGSVIAIEQISGARSVELYDTASQRLLATLRESPERMGSKSTFSFGPKGRFLAKPCGVQGISFWDIHRIRSELSALGIDWREQGASNHERANEPDGSENNDVQVATVSAIDFRLYPREAPAGEEFPVGLGSHANHSTTGSLTGQQDGFSFESLPRGWVELESVHFQIGSDIVLLDDKNPVASDVSVDQSANTIHFLHTLLKGDDTDLTKSPVRYIIRYEDGTESTFEIETDRHICDCRANHILSRLNESKVAWIGETSQHKLINAVRSTWSNPFPEKKIASIDMQLAEDAGYSFVCLAITGERQLRDRTP